MLDIVPIENRILLIRGEKVMLDRDLAELYGVETRVLNQAARRNKKRFPDDFMFQLTRMEAEYLASEDCVGGVSRSQIVILNGKNAKNKGKIEILKSQIVTSSSRSQIVTLKKDGRGSNIKYFPYVFTEQGVAMLSSVLKSDKAIEVNVTIMRAFVKIRKLVYSYDELSKKIMQMEKKYDKSIVRIFEIINKLMEDKDDDKNKKEIGFKCNV